MSSSPWCMCQNPIHTKLDKWNSLNLLINIEYRNRVENDTCQIQIVMCNYMSSTTCLTQLEQNLVACVTCN
jgi:hypothetical protein